MTRARLYGIRTRVQFRSIGNCERMFFGVITGYTADNEVAFIRDDGRPKPRPVGVDRIVGRACTQVSNLPDIVA